MKSSLSIIILLFIFILYSSCKEAKEQVQEKSVPVENKVEESQKEKQPEAPVIPSISLPEGYTKLADVMGNLDKDEDQERVIVYETPREGEMGTEREIRVYKLTYDDTWSLWHKSTKAVLSSRHGGMMGDPFEGVKIERKCIVIEHFGGSREKWGYVHRYRRQDKEWKLIGASVRYGAPCDFWDYFDYNLSTGKIAVKKEREDCDDEANSTREEYTITHKLPELPLMKRFYPGNNELKTEKDEETFYY